jgi:hypothetical protein
VSDSADALAGIDLSESYVLSWSTEAESLLIDADLLLTPGHPAFEEPRPAEKQCYRPAWIEFPWCTGVRAGDRTGPAAEAVGALGDGKISSLRSAGDGSWELAGEFGTVIIRAEAPMVRLRNNRP